MKRKITLYFFSILLAPSFSCYTQVADDFTDGNFTNNPAWSGNDTDFTVNPSFQLQLNSSGTDTSYLSLPNTYSLNNCQWEFWIRLNFSPSSNNLARVYLVSDQNNLKAPLNGYYLQFGEALSNDQVELFRQSGTTSVSVCRGTTIIANAFTIRVKVTRDNAGLWKLFIDPSGGPNFVQEASGTDAAFATTNFFGIYCKYTSSNATNFYFDDFYVGPIVLDTTPPSVDSLNVISQNQLDVVFSEAVEITSSQTVTNYSANNGLGNPTAAVRDGTNPAKVHLTFGTNFTNGLNNTLIIANVQDLSGNAITSASGNFVYYVPMMYDVVLNEIMADPDPPVQLPNYEYLELFNRTIYPINLSNWRIQIGSSVQTIPAVTILPDSFLVLTSTTAAPNYSGIQVLGISSFPALTNTGATAVLLNPSGNIISAVSYTDQWYQDAGKEEGGYSLEQIDADNPCGEMSNWRASVDAKGGTPGKRNSVLASNSDVAAPKLLRASVIDIDTIQLFFSEAMDSASMLSPSSYTIDNGIGNPTSVILIPPFFSSVKLSLPLPIDTGIIYTITVTNSFTDCAGNAVSQYNKAKFAIPLAVSPNDIVINEVMPDPKDGGTEWIEIYNRSSKVIDLKEISVCSQDNAGNFTSIYQITQDGWLIFPGDYYVLSGNGASIIKSQYNTANPEGFIDLSGMPGLNNDSGKVLLISSAQVIIDQLNYYKEWHLPLLNDTKGISLERINYDKPTQDASNWHSAAESVGGATPAYKNSQYTDGESGSEVTLSPEVFSPDNDGYNDILTINYSFDIPGMLGNAQIYDSRGRLIKNLVRNELLASSGTFFWDGITDDKLKARIGIYILYFEAFDIQGTVKKYKKSFVVAGKL